MDVTKVQAYGPWFEQEIKPGQTTHFTVDASEAGSGELEAIVVNDSTGMTVPTRIIDNEDNTFLVECTPQNTGSYTTNLKYGGLKVPLSKKTSVKPSVDVSKVQVEGLEPSKF